MTPHVRGNLPPRFPSCVDMRHRTVCVFTFLTIAGSAARSQTPSVAPPIGDVFSSQGAPNATDDRARYVSKDGRWFDHCRYDTDHMDQNPYTREYGEPDYVPIDRQIMNQYTRCAVDACAVNQKAVCWGKKETLKGYAGEQTTEPAYPAPTKVYQGNTTTQPAQPAQPAKPGPSTQWAIPAPYKFNGRLYRGTLYVRVPDNPEQRKGWNTQGSIPSYKGKPNNFAYGAARVVQDQRGRYVVQITGLQDIYGNTIVESDFARLGLSNNYYLPR